MCESRFSLKTGFMCFCVAYPLVTKSLSRPWRDLGKVGELFDVQRLLKGLQPLLCFLSAYLVPRHRQTTSLLIDLEWQVWKSPSKRAKHTTRTKIEQTVSCYWHLDQRRTLLGHTVPTSSLLSASRQLEPRDSHQVRQMSSNIQNICQYRFEYVVSSIIRILSTY